MKGYMFTESKLDYDQTKKKEEKKWVLLKIIRLMKNKNFK